jgi:hypothetical protein
MNTLRQLLTQYFPLLLIGFVLLIGMKYRSYNKSTSEEVKEIPERFGNIVIDKSVISGNLIYLDTTTLQTFIMVTDTMNKQEVIKKKYVDLVAKKIYE